MKDDIPDDDFKTIAVELVRDVSKGEGDLLSRTERATLADAVEQDLRAGSADASVAEARLAKVETQTRELIEAVIAITDTADHELRDASADAAVTEERMVKLETQTHVLSDAVIAINETISETPDTLAPAVQAVKDEM